MILNGGNACRRRRGGGRVRAQDWIFESGVGYIERASERGAGAGWLAGHIMKVSVKD